MARLRPEGHPEVKALALCPPEVKAAEAASWLGKQRFLGIKPYHLFAARSDSQNAAIEEYAPESDVGISGRPERHTHAAHRAGRGHCG